jgi:hypothetical protein
LVGIRQRRLSRVLRARGRGVRLMDGGILLGGLILGDEMVRM